jgi:hypothetical protein
LVIVTSHSCCVRPVLQRHRQDLRTTAGARAQEVRRVVNADRELAAIRNRRRSADARGALDGRRVDASVHDAPRGVVFGAEVKVTA